jgi:hypothetical protein
VGHVFLDVKFPWFVVVVDDFDVATTGINDNPGVVVVAVVDDLNNNDDGIVDTRYRMIPIPNRNTNTILLRVCICIFLYVCSDTYILIWCRE